jgi:hypothetical protein
LQLQVTPPCCQKPRTTPPMTARYARPDAWPAALYAASSRARLLSRGRCPGDPTARISCCPNMI